LLSVKYRFAVAARRPPIVYGIDGHQDASMILRDLRPEATTLATTLTAGRR
jgi:hypothetical protein